MRTRELFNDECFGGLLAVRTKKTPEELYQQGQMFQTTLRLTQEQEKYISQDTSLAFSTLWPGHHHNLFYRCFDCVRRGYNPFLL